MFSFGERVRVIDKKSLVFMPVAVVIAVTVFFGIDAFPVYSSGERLQRPVASTTPGPTPTPSPMPSDQPVSQPAPASPSPKATVAAVRSGNMLSIPSIGLNAQVVDVGLTAGNAIDVPAGRQVGYWTGSAQPGVPGATFLDGHVDSIFAHLNRLSVGQAFSLRFNGQTFHYQVAHTETVALEGIDMNKALRTYGGASEGLNMMTCAGTFIESMNTYDKRFVVYAVRIN